jgi:hypothetical protein
VSAEQKGIRGVQIVDERASTSLDMHAGRQAGRQAETELDITSREKLMAE